MVKIITFEGADYSGKSTTHRHLAKQFSKREDLFFNEGPVYPTELTARLLILANQSNDADIEYLYSMIFGLDKIELSRAHQKDNRTFFQDRYWPSVVAYGKFKNREKSIHQNPSLKGLFLPPTATIYFSCSHEEKIRRSEKRGRKSVIDKFLLDFPNELSRLEREIDGSLEGLPNILRIDTTLKNVEEVSSEIEEYVTNLNL